jgi:hypothetical protein
MGEIMKQTTHFYIAVLTAFLCLGLSGNKTHAWGDTGHRVICEIAFRLVQPETRETIRELISADPEPQTFADSCIYPDHGPTNRRRIRDQEHYVNLPRDWKGLTTNACPEAPKCVLTAIESDQKTLSSLDLPQDVRRIALKSLGHWVGDLHQPLHVSFLDDRGGNKIATSGCARNLHSAWDTCLVQAAVGPDPQKAAQALLGRLESEQSKQWAASKPLDWANETFSVTTSPATRYCVLHGKSCDRLEGTVTLTADYEQKNIPVIRQQLLKAGVRLAHLLDTTLAKH